VSRQWIVDAEKGKSRAPVGLLLRTLEALGMRVSIAAEAAPLARTGIDIDARVDKARGNKR
jgi:HTH-type transcriptional regulator/antitoxin HipB